MTKHAWMMISTARPLNAFRWSPTLRALPALLLAAWLIILPTAGLAQPGDLALSAFPDATGASGESQAFFLNPAAATELGQAALGLWAVLPQEKADGSGPLYGLTLLDPGITLAGGLAITYAPRGSEQPFSLSYAIAGRLGPAGLGVRPVWTRTADGAGRWSVDAGLAWHLAPWVSLGLSGLDLPIAENTLPGRGLVGITFTATPLAGTLLEGAQLTLGVADENLDEAGSLVGRVGLRIPLGHAVRLAVGYQKDLENGDNAGWGGSLGVALGQLRFDLGYESNQVYRAGLELGW